MIKFSTLEAREQFSEMVNQAAYGKEHVVITRRRKPLAVVISMADYKKFIENQSK